MPEFTPDAEVDLDRTRWLIVRREQSWVRHTKPLAQGGANAIWIRVLRIERIARQNLFPKRHNLRNYAANVNMVAAIPAAGVMVPPSTGTGFGPPLKQAFETALNAPDLKRSGRSNRTLFQITFSSEEAHAAENDGFVVLTRIRGKPNLRSRVHIRLSHCVPVTWEGCVDFRNRRHIAIRAARVAVVTQSQTKGKIRLELPRVAPIQTCAVIGFPNR